MKISKLNLIFPFLAFILFSSFTLPEPQQDKNTLNISDFSATNSRISRGQLKVYKNVRAGFGEDFAFDGLKLKVTQYTFAYVPKGGQSYIETVNGNSITAKIREKLNQAKPGDILIISQVNVKGDGWSFNRTINGLVLTVY